jgi:nicotinamide-nucleotide adenylyltransferase
MDSSRGLVIGRYQPFHNGHLEIIREILNDPECDELVIAIGSAQESYTIENPYTAGERILMIDRSLKNEGYSNYLLIPIPDLNRYAVWVAHVESLVPRINIIYTNNKLTHRLFSERNYRIKTPNIYDRDKFSGTKIRQMMINDENWTELVPKPVAEIIKSIDGVKRLMELNE